jgi:hypothetical protein
MTEIASSITKDILNNFFMLILFPNVQLGMVTDVGGVNDKSFNQSAWEALQAIEKESGLRE